jgi:cytochrome c biogenesis protein CcmG, thiol:disulfide interchange protein DsbE
VKRALFLISLLTIALASSAHAATTPSCSTIKAAKVSKGIALPCLNGSGSITFEAIRGPVLVNVWGSWCEPCKEEIPHLVDIAKLNKVAIVGIDVEERNMAAGQKFVASHKMSWPQLYDVKAKTRGIFGMGVPVTWFIDANGKVLYKQIGLFQSTTQIKELVKKYFGIAL